MYIIVSTAHPRHCQPACILPVSKLPGTWREKLRAITEPPLRGVSSLWAQQPDSVSMGTILWPPGCCWHHLMYIFRYKTSPFISEIVSNGLNNTEGQLLSPKENTEHPHLWFFPLDSRLRKLKLLSHLTLRCTIKTKSYFVQREKLDDCCEEWLKIIPPNLLIYLNIILCNCLFTKHRHILCMSTKKNIMWKIWWRCLIVVYSIFTVGPGLHTVNAKQQDREILQKY